MSVAVDFKHVDIIFGKDIPAALSDPSLNGSELFIHPELWQQQLRIKEEQLQAANKELSYFRNGNFTFNTYFQILTKKLKGIMRRKWNADADNKLSLR